jgi:uncharacterized protein
MLSEKLKQKLDKLIEFLTDKKIIVAFSGGVDSSLLAYLSSKYGKETLLVTEKSILYPEEEIKETKEFSKKHDIKHMIIERNPLEDSHFTRNPKDRCYVCKLGLYEDIKKIFNKKKFNIIVDGSNSDDLNDYRPGMKALKELDISTPYVKFDISKSDIREICAHFELEVQSKPSMACFSSRIPYNENIDKQKLERIRKAEKFLRNQYQLSQLRVRHHKDKLARIEILPEELSKVMSEQKLNLIAKRLKQIGFNYVTLDLEGFRSGSMNEVLDLPSME